MPDFLDMESAQKQARRLKGIPEFSFDEENVTATAEDLVMWCTGKILDGRVWSAHDQAVWLIDEARMKFSKWLGPAALRRLFLEKFDRNKMGPAYQDFKSLEKQYGKPDPSWSKRLLRSASHKEQISELRMIGIRNALYYTEGPGRVSIEGRSIEAMRDREFWREALENSVRRYPDQVAAIRAEAEAQGPSYWTGGPFEPGGERMAS